MDALAFTSAKASLLHEQEQTPQSPATQPASCAFRSARAAHHDSPNPAPPSPIPTTCEHAFSLTVRGLVHHRDTGALAALTHLPGPAALRLEREPDNEHDANAVAVLLVDGGKKLGYVAKEEAACLAPFLDQGDMEAAPPVCVERVLLQPLSPPPTPARKEEEEEEVVIKPDPNASSSTSSSPTPTSVTIQVVVRTQQEGAFLALQQAFPPPVPAATLDDDQATTAAAAAAAAAQQEQERVLTLLAAACAKIEKEERTGLRVLSLFDGIGAALVSLLQEECPIALYCSSEVDPNALAVMEAHFPAFNPDGDSDNEPPPLPFLHVPLGDVRTIDARMVARIRPDLLIGGSPCQDLSRLNKDGKGLAGPRSKLFFKFVRVRDLCLLEQQAHRGDDGGEGLLPVIVLENVVPRGCAMVSAINSHMQLAPLRLNASEVSAASRDRLYWSNLPFHGLTPPADTDAVLADVLLSSTPAYALPGNVAADGKARCVVRTAHRDRNLVEDPGHPLALAVGSKYRPLLPEEEERLMGFDDGYTRTRTHGGGGHGQLSDTARDELVGNSFSVPVVRQLLKRLKPLARAQIAAARAQAVEGMKLLP